MKYSNKKNITLYNFGKIKLNLCARLAVPKLIKEKQEWSPQWAGDCLWGRGGRTVVTAVTTPRRRRRTRRAAGSTRTPPCPFLRPPSVREETVCVPESLQSSEPREWQHKVETQRQVLIMSQPSQAPVWHIILCFYAGGETDLISSRSCTLNNKYDKIRICYVYTTVFAFLKTYYF